VLPVHLSACVHDALSVRDGGVEFLKVGSQCSHDFNPCCVSCVRLCMCLVARLRTWNGLRQPCRFGQRLALRCAGGLRLDCVDTLGAGAVAAVHAQLLLVSCVSKLQSYYWAFPTMLRVSFLPALAHHFVSPRQRRHKYPQISSDVTHSRVVCISWMCVGRVWGRAWIPATVQAARISVGAMPNTISTGSA